MGIAIVTRFHGPTNTRGSRYSAKAGGKPGGAAFEVVMGGRYEAVGLPAPAPVPAAPVPAPADDLAATVAALAARLAVLERAAARAGRAPRTAGHAATIRRAWAMRAHMRARADLDRRALLAANEHCRTVEGQRDAARAAAQLSARDAIDTAANAEFLRDELTAAEVMLSRRTCEFTALASTAAADRARLDQLAPLLAAIGSIGQSAPALTPAAV